MIWDLRKNEQIIKLSDAQSRGRWRSVYWHPSVATQLWIASEADEAPAVQLWDLRYAHAPAKTLQLHSRGVLGLTGCAKDPDMMASCGKDNKLLCWNIDSEGEVLSEVPTNQWYSDIAWCPRNPALIAASSLDGNVSVYSLFGGSQQQVQTASKIADSFPNMEQLSQVEPFPQTTTESFHDLKKPPKWLKRPAGVAFGFGGKFATFDANTRQIKVSHLVTDEKLVERSEKLTSTVDETSCIEYCKDKADNAKNQHTRYIWHFLKAHFTENPSAELLNLLGRFFFFFIQK